MRVPVDKKSSESLIASYQIAHNDIGWYFRVSEVSAGCWRVEGSDAWGRLISINGVDPDQLLQAAIANAKEMHDAGALP